MGTGDCSCLEYSRESYYKIYHFLYRKNCRVYLLDMEGTSKSFEDSIFIVVFTGTVLVYLILYRIHME